MVMAIERWRPWKGWTRESAPAGLARVQREMEDMFDRFFGDWSWPRWPGAARGGGPSVDMVDKKDEVLLRADLPGLEQKDIEVHVEEGMLTIRGERKEEKEVKEEEYYFSERWAGSFSRSLALPPGVDSEKVKATFKNGVLEVHLPKTQQAKGKRIEVKVE
jgi:HSP20 family protein